MKKLCVLLLTVLTVTLGALAQAATDVSGIVLSAEENEPVVGATVMVRGTNVGTMTDVDGKFRLKAPAGSKTLIVSYVGMHTQEVAVAPTVRVLLENDAQALDEVIVTGYGTTRRAAFTGAASIVDGDIIDRKPDVNFVKSLEGQVPGFQYNNSTSMPGQWGAVYVRGRGSLSSNTQPLYVIDGMPVNSDYDALSTSTNNFFDPMSAYNPNDIESVTVLKDAAATAIYGSRAANGVIVITTKKGAEGKFQINLDIKQGLTHIANNNMKYANAQETLDLYARGYVAARGGTYEDWHTRLSDNYKNNYGWDGKSSYDWMDAVTRTGYYQDYNLSFAGTSGNTNYYVSLGYIDTEGIVIGSDNKRYSGRVGIDTKYKYFTAGVNASYSYSKNHAFSQSTGGSNSNPTVGATTSMLPFYPFYNEDRTDYWSAGTRWNPLAVKDPKLGDNYEITNETLNANPWLKVDLPYGIWAKTSFGANIMNQTIYDYWSGVYNPQAIAYGGLGQQTISRTSTLTWTNTFGWDYSFNEKHSIELLLGQEMQRYDYHQDYYSRVDFPFAASGMRDMSTAASDNGSSYYKSESRLASYFADAHYNYDNKYYASASFRRDGSSIFGSDKRWGNFWSVGAKWRITQEDFLQDNPILTNAALRASYGTVGNQSLPDLYASRGYYMAGYNYNQTPGMVPENIENPELSWETSKKFDIGFDVSLINRVHFTFDFYNEDTSDALYEVPLSMTTGFDSYYKNIGKIRNTGIEFGVNGTVFSNRDINVNAFANLTWNKNKVIKLADGAEESTYTIIEEGRPFRQFYMPEYAGVDRETGRALYYLNETGDELTTNYNEAAKRYVGSAEPKVYGAFGVSATAYGFDFSMQFNYRLGAKVYDTGHNFTGWCMNTMRTPLKTLVYDSWTPENTNAKYPQFIYGDPYGDSNGNYSSRWLMSGDYLRLSNITLGYTFPAKWTKKALIQKLRLYTTFDNVHTWTKDEFVGYNPDTYASGVIAWQYPAVFTFTGGVQVTF